MTFDIQYVVVLWNVSFRVFFYMSEWQPSQFLSQFPSLKASMPQRDFVSELLLFFFFYCKNRLTQARRHSDKVYFSRCKNSCLLAQASWRDFVVNNSEQTARDGTLQDLGWNNTNTGTDYVCQLFFFSNYYYYVFSLSHNPTWALVWDSAPVNDRKLHALHSACPCWCGRWIGFFGGVLGGLGGGSGSEGHRWQLVVHRGLPRALALSTYCVLLTGPWCHHGPLALTACHHVTVGLTVKQCRVGTVNNKKMFSNIQFSLDASFF